MKINKVKKLIFVFSLIFTVLTAINFVLAAEIDTGLDQVEATGLGVSDPRVIIANIIRIVLGFLGIIAVGLIIYAGWLWMTASGEPEKIEKAKKILIGAVIGLVICLSSFAIASFILSRLTSATSGGDGTNTGGSDFSSSGSSVFKIASTRPSDGDEGVIRNVVIKTFLNSAVANQIGQEILQSNFKVEKVADINSVTGAETNLEEVQTVNGQLEIVDGRMIISFKDTDNCEDESGTLNCLPSYSKFKVTVNGFSGIVSVNNQSLSCSAGAACEFYFSTGDQVDSVPPTSGIVPVQMCQDDGTLTSEANTVYGWGKDDKGISSVSFKQKLSSAAEDEQAGTPIAGNGLTYQNVSFRYDTSGLTIGQKYDFSIYVSDIADHQSSSTFSATLRPGHCCNGIKDLGEADVDCGGDCGACDGGACSADISEPQICSDSLCASQFCTTQNSSRSACSSAGYENESSCCLCRRQPVVMGVFPTGGFCSGDINKACLSNSDCSDGDECNLETPNGATGNFVTISGKYFGSSRGKVYFSGSTTGSWVEAKLADDAASGNAACAANVWSDIQIIAVVPSGAAAGPIKITSASGFSDDTASAPALTDFVVNSIVRPGLCKLEPDNGKMNDAINYYGIKLSGGQAYYGNLSGYVSGVDSAVTNDKQASAKVPNLATGRTSSFMAKITDKVYSNYLNFYKNAEPYSGPSITGFEPSRGKAGQYITIRGSGFGATKGTSKVFFASNEADYEFPEICQDSVWSDNQVIVKVPEDVDNGNYNIKMQIGSYEIDTSKISPDKFEINDSLGLAPNLCKINPTRGQVGSEVNIYGEDFGEKDSALVRFQLNKDQAGNNISFWGKEKKADKAVTMVPSAAITGGVKIIQGDLQSNPLNFTVGKCSLDSDCGGEAVCCPTGSPAAGKCAAFKKDSDGNVTESSAQGLCFSKVKASVYEWDFTTDSVLCDPNDMCGGTCCAGGTCMNNSCVCPDSTPNSCSDGCCSQNCDSETGKCLKDPSESCAGYGNQCSDSYYCPNSPGKCSGGDEGCECCCDKTKNTGDGNPECCTGLTCEDSCGSGGNFGLCSGCTVKNGGAVDQAASNAKCNCSGTSGKVCDTDGANGLGVCKDCASISSQEECNNKGVGVCCVDAEKNTCRSGIGLSGDSISYSGSDYSYCAYYVCGGGACVNKPVASSTSVVYSTKSECDTKCSHTTLPGKECVKEDETTGQRTCNNSICTDLTCLNEDGSGLGDTGCGACCCDPNNDQCGAPLQCQADRGSCTGSGRGLCCGCQSDNQCGSSDTVGCGSDSCCQARPTVSETKPYGSNVCRNSIIQATFDMPMQISSFSGNVIVAGDYGSDSCPAGTTYLAAAYKPTLAAKIKTWFLKVPLVNKLFISQANAEDLSGNFCAISGTLSGRLINNNTKTVLEFMPAKVLAAGKKYYIIIKGDSDTTDAVKEGVLSQTGISLKPTSEKTFNGKTYKGVIWYFTTKNASEADSGICKISYVSVSPYSYVFNTIINDPSDDSDATKDSVIKDSDKIFRASAYADNGQRVIPTDVYNWRWDWTIANQGVVKFKNNSATDNSEVQTLIAQNVSEDSTLVYAKATITVDQLNEKNSTVGSSKQTAAPVYVFQCSNIWPAYKTDLQGNTVWEPWSDKSNNCTVAGGDCYNTNYELYYCRDAGEAGTADDLPEILSDTAVVRPYSAAQNILKEFYFFRKGQ